MLTLPEYPWDAMTPYRELAAAHPGGTVDLSIGTPVDPTPQVIQDALAAASDAPGYPTTHGRPQLREVSAPILVWRRCRACHQVLREGKRNRDGRWAYGRW